MKTSAIIALATLMISVAAIVIIGYHRSEFNDYLLNIIINAIFIFVSISVTVFFVDNLISKIRRTEGKAYDAFDYNSFVLDVKKAKTRIRILNTFIYPFTSLPEYKEQKEELIKNLQIAIDKHPKLKIQVLFVNPFSSAARQRAQERNDEDFYLRITENVVNLKTLMYDKFFYQGKLLIDWI